MECRSFFKVIKYNLKFKIKDMKITNTEHNNKINNNKKNIPSMNNNNKIINVNIINNKKIVLEK